MGDGASSASGTSASNDWATDTEAEIALGVLTSVEGNSTLSQRALARECPLRERVVVALPEPGIQEVAGPSR